MKKAYITPSTIQHPILCSSSLLSASLNGVNVLSDGGYVSEQDGIIEGDVKAYRGSDDWDW